jgi:hypothetical protein
LISCPKKAIEEKPLTVGNTGMTDLAMAEIGVTSPEDARRRKEQVLTLRGERKIP